MQHREWAVIGTSDTALRIAQACLQRGVEARAYPAVVPSVNPDIRAQLAGIVPLDTCVFTSRRAVELVYENADPTLSSAIARSTVYAIGPSTGARVRELFGVEPCVPDVYSSEGLANMLAGRSLGRTALFSSTARSDSLVSILKKCSNFFVEPKLYGLGLDQRITKRFLDGLIAGRFKGLVFTCSTAAGIMTNTQSVSGVRIIAMGSRTLGSLRSAGYEAMVPTNSTVEEVVKLIVELEDLDSGLKV